MAKLPVQGTFLFQVPADLLIERQELVIGLPELRVVVPVLETHRCAAVHLLGPVDGPDRIDDYLIDHEVETPLPLGAFQGPARFAVVTPEGVRPLEVLRVPLAPVFPKLVDDPIVGGGKKRGI